MVAQWVGIDTALSLYLGDEEMNTSRNGEKIDILEDSP